MPLRLTHLSKKQKQPVLSTEEAFQNKPTSAINLSSCYCKGGNEITRRLVVPSISFQM